MTTKKTPRKPSRAKAKPKSTELKKVSRPVEEPTEEVAVEEIELTEAEAIRLESASAMQHQIEIRSRAQFSREHAHVDRMLSGMNATIKERHADFMPENWVVDSTGKKLIKRS